MERKESIGKDATSEDTVEDLEENEVRDDVDDTNPPSPDGSFDEAGEVKDADPV